jgi:hypothetical protein
MDERIRKKQSKEEKGEARKKREKSMRKVKEETTGQ